MAIFAMSDLHLSFYKDKPMDIFGSNWENHSQKIKNNWNSVVNDDDYVLVGGDISWAKNFEELEPDMEFIRKLKGKKIFLNGNHDYWWSSVSRMRELYPEIEFLRMNAVKADGYVICGTRGWLCPNDTYYTPHDKKIYLREANRLEKSICEALSQTEERSRIIVMTHYPPTNDKKENSLFMEILKKYGIKEVIYGHLHGAESFNASWQGERDGIKFSLVSSDYLDFMPLKIK